MERIAWIGLDRQYGCEVSPMIVELKSGGFLRAQTQERGPPLACASIWEAFRRKDFKLNKNSYNQNINVPFLLGTTSVVIYNPIYHNLLYTSEFESLYF